MSIPTTFLHPLVFLDEGDHITIGRRDIDSYAIFPRDGALLVQRLAAGESPESVRAWYRETYHADVDLADLLETLTELQFVRTGDSGPVRPTPVRGQRFAQLLFGAPGWTVMAALVVAAIVIVVTDHHYRPHVSHLFFTPSLLIMDLTLFAFAIPLIWVHEMFHVLAGRRLGLHATLGLGWRAWFLVAETRMDGLVSVPARQRYLPMAAGMVADVVMIAVMTISAYAADRAGLPPLVGALFLAAAFGGVVRFVWQCLAFLRTDVYYLVSTAAGTIDLHTVSRQRLADDVRRLLRRAPRHDPAQWPARDATVAQWYRWVLLAGYGVLILSTALILIPALMIVTKMAVARMADPAANPWLTFDAGLFIVLNLAQFAVPAVLAIRRRAHAEGASS